MEHTTAHTEHHDTGTKEIWRTFWILLILTLIELGFGFWLMYTHNESGRLALKGAIIILMLAKAFYIVAYFMHLKGEVKNLVMTIIVPLFLFVWFIIAFLYDGDSYKNLRNNYDRNHYEKSLEKAPVKEHSPEKGHDKKPAME